MTATLGSGDDERFSHARPDLLLAVTGRRPVRDANNIRLDQEFGTATVQRVSIAQYGTGVIVGVFPAEQLKHARQLYSHGRGSALVAAAVGVGWDVKAHPHLGFWNAGESLRLYLNPPVQPSVYAARWENEDFARIRQVDRDELMAGTWPWLIERGYATSSDQPAFERFLAVLGRRPAHVRPGLRLVLSLDARVYDAEGKVAAIGDVIRAALNEVLVAVGDPPLGVPS